MCGVLGTLLPDHSASHHMIVTFKMYIKNDVWYSFCGQVVDASDAAYKLPKHGDYEAQTMDTLIYLKNGV